MAKKVLSDLNCDGNKVQNACLGLVKSSGVPNNAEDGTIYYDTYEENVCYCMLEQDMEGNWQLAAKKIPFSLEMINKISTQFTILSGQSSYTINLHRIITYSGVRGVLLSKIDYSTGIQKVINPKDYDIEFQLNNSDASQVTATVTFSTIPNAGMCKLDIIY